MAINFKSLLGGASNAMKAMNTASKKAATPNANTLSTINSATSRASATVAPYQAAMANIKAQQAALTKEVARQKALNAQAMAGLGGGGAITASYGNATSSKSMQDILNEIVNPLTQNVYKGPMFSEVLPFDKAWESLQPNAQEVGYSQVNPFINRQLSQDVGNYNLGLAAQGGGRFGSNVGSIEADAERNRKAQVQDWVNQQMQGFKTLWYDPTREAFNRATELNPNATPNMPNIPTWNEVYGKNNLMTNALNT